MCVRGGVAVAAVASQVGSKVRLTGCGVAGPPPEHGPLAARAQWERPRQEGEERAACLVAHANGCSPVPWDTPLGCGRMAGGRARASKAAGGAAAARPEVVMPTSIRPLSRVHSGGGVVAATVVLVQVRGQGHHALLGRGACAACSDVSRRIACVRLFGWRRRSTPCSGGSAARAAGRAPSARTSLSRRARLSSRHCALR